MGISCPGKQKFDKGWNALGLRDSTSTEFAWHGTPTVDCLRSICWVGHDPSKRSGQAHGPGEYFSVDSNVSKGYASSTGYLIVCMLLKCSQNSTPSSNPSYRVV